MERIKQYYDSLPGRLAEIRKVVKGPMTLSEKILYAHLYEPTTKPYLRGIDYVEFRPDRVAMQDATAQMALLQFMMAGKSTSAVPVSIHCDHLIMACEGADADLAKAKEGNKEVYSFLESVATKYGLDFWQPGKGIIHQIVLENYAFPGGMMVGTDSHTPNAGGLGMVSVGVGGADAVDVMAGMGWELKMPRIIGIKLTGKLNGWVAPKDVILKIAGMMTVKGGTGSIVEYFGDGAESLSTTGKATICNMGAEIGATCSIFPYDDEDEKYLIATGREEVAKAASAIREHLVADPEVYDNPTDFFDNYYEIDLSKLEPYINGPFTPDLATPISMMKEAVEKNGWPEDISVGLIGSCTNSSYEDLSRAASIVKNALNNNVDAKAEFKITPGSDRIREIAEKDGFLDLFREIGGVVYANACGPCIGQWDRKGSEKKERNTIIHSFNRNFAKRADGNPNTFAFVASPEIVTALTLAGKLTFNPMTDSLVDKNGNKINLAEPRGSKLPSTGFGEAQQPLRRQDKSVKIAINPDSERLQALASFSEWDGKDFLNLPLLIQVKGKCTTDHISPAGKWLRYRGHLENISKNYMSGAVNRFNDQTDNVLNQLKKEYGQVNEVASYYKKKKLGSIVIGEENFGEGSSREHAAMEPRYLNVKAIIVKSFARIHETNLKKQGVLTLTFANKDDYDKICENDKFDIIGLKDFAPGVPLEVVITHDNGKKEKIQVTHSYNSAQIKWFKAGSALNLIKKEIK